MESVILSLSRHWDRRLHTSAKSLKEQGEDTTIIAKGQNTVRSTRLIHTLYERAIHLKVMCRVRLAAHSGEKPLEITVLVVDLRETELRRHEMALLARLLHRFSGDATSEPA